MPPHAHPCKGNPENTSPKWALILIHVDWCLHPSFNEEEDLLHVTASISRNFWTSFFDWEDKNSQPCGGCLLQTQSFNKSLSMGIYAANLTLPYPNQTSCEPRDTRLDDSSIYDQSIVLHLGLSPQWFVKLLMMSSFAAIRPSPRSLLLIFSASSKDNSLILLQYCSSCESPSGC